jgi:hypothetical protein
MDYNLPDCPSIQVRRDILSAIVRVESAYNPFAIGVVGNKLSRQPRNVDEAIATVRDLESRGLNYSVGMAQVNRSNFNRYGINTPELAFDVCANLEAGAKILQECYSRSKNDWGKALSCYYSGNFVTGYKDGYVQKVSNAFFSAAQADAKTNGLNGINAPAQMLNSSKYNGGRLLGGVASVEPDMRGNEVKTLVSVKQEPLITAPGVVNSNLEKYILNKDSGKLDAQINNRFLSENSKMVSDDAARVF